VKVSCQKAAALKGTGVALSKASSSYARSTLKVGALSKSGAPPKAVMPKSTETQTVLKAEVLKISTRAKRPASVEPSSTPKGKQAKVNVASSPGSTPIHRAIVRPQPLTEFDDGRVAACAMLGASSVVSSSSSSSSDSFGSVSIISAGLDDIPKMLDAETAHQMVETIAMEPRTDTSAGMFLYIL
jgi:hypothetical protein